MTYEDIKNISYAKQSLVVNIGAKVMLTANDANGEYVNGTMGTIIDISNIRLCILPPTVLLLSSMIFCDLTA